MDHATAQLALTFTILQRFVHRLPENVFDLIRMHYPHPAAPLRGACTLKCRNTCYVRMVPSSWPVIQTSTHVREIVVSNRGTAFRHQIGELIGRTYKEVITDRLSDLILILVAIRYAVPVRVL